MASDSNPHVVQDADMSMWDDPSFTNLYDNFGAASAESPFDGSRLFDINAAGAADSPGFAVRNTLEDDAAKPNHSTQPFHTRSLVSSRSAESSSQDSASETSTRKRQNTSATSESPPAAHFPIIKGEFDGKQFSTNGADGGNNPAFIQNFGRSMHNLSLEPDFVNGNTSQTMASTHFDFDSAASSPGGGNMEMSDAMYTAQIQAQMRKPRNIDSRHQNDPAMGTVEPSQFFFNSSTASPASVKAPQTQDASPSAIFSNPTPSSGGDDLFSSNQLWNNNGQNPAWTNDYSSAFASPGGALGLTPSPVMNNATKASVTKSSPADGRIPLHIAPIPAKSRVETQINIRLTLDWVPPGVKNLHLPTHTIAKAKLLAKDAVPSDDTLELHTMLVCTSAMSQSHLRQRALETAAAQDNAEIQARGQSGALKKEEEEEQEDDKPANGGEVRICTNCINRERKRAARKKLKKEEEQAHWEKYETERVIVFNTNEYKSWQEWQQSPAPKENNNMQANDYYRPPDTAVQVVAPMRIACYCRHQNEKDGFQVIFTIKDHQGNVVAQEMSDSILITDDHKTHPLTTVGGQVWYDGQFPPQAAAPYASHSMVDMHSHAQALQQSKSTSNLPSYNLMGGQPFHAPNNIHPMTNLPSQPASASMTPRNLSRPASPTNVNQCGPSKKRKSSSAHRRVPSTLTMTRVDTNQSLPGAPMSASAPFSPTSAGFVGDASSYVSMPHSASRAQFHTGPSTPIDQNGAFAFAPLNRTNSMDSTYAFYSAPSSAHQSRAPSPVLVGPNIAAFQRQQAHGGANALPTRPNPFSMPSQTLTNTLGDPDRPPPMINKINPAEGPLSGGIEVSIYGSGFTPSMTVLFGDQEAVTTTFWGEKALVALLPASAQTGNVSVTIGSGQRQFPSPPAGQAPVFKYVNKGPDLQTMELALRFYSQKETGREDQWQALAQSAANAWMSQGGPMGSGSANFGGQQNVFTEQANDMRFAQR
ncbi:hypothetical protein AAFC00_001321 [Neodothiora populina]|uniref:IPT/TIG domain-containing protein n=1 Tax=Neodothiora populina TaxID=2781224 RepID=A0ABR3PNH7_9PEZI